MEEVTIEVMIRKFDIATIGMIELSKKSKLSNGGGGLLTGRFDTHSFGGSMPPPFVQVVEVRRDIHDISVYLQADGSRPSLGDEPEAIFSRWHPDTVHHQRSISLCR